MATNDNRPTSTCFYRRSQLVGLPGYLLLYSWRIFTYPDKFSPGTTLSKFSSVDNDAIILHIFTFRIYFQAGLSAVITLKIDFGYQASVQIGQWISADSLLRLWTVLYDAGVSYKVVVLLFIAYGLISLVR